jgi:hypothetical protein
VLEAFSDPALDQLPAEVSQPMSTSQKSWPSYPPEAEQQQTDSGDAIEH